MLPDNSTRTPQTEARYKARYNQLIRQFERETGRQGLHFFIRWLIANKNAGDYAKNTWWQYKSAILANLDVSQPDIQTLYDRLKTEPPPDMNPPARQCKTKNISPKSWDYLIKVLGRHARESTVQRVAIFMRATILTGLRPAEWEGAVLECHEGHYMLSVTNAKHTNGRGHGEGRQIDILTPQAVSVILRNLKLMDEYQRKRPGRTRVNYFETLRLAMWRAYDKERKAQEQRGVQTRPLRLVPYSARHQFKNSARKADLSTLEIAYLMGHASVETHQRFYGRRNAASSGFDVAPHVKTKDMPQVLLDSQARFETRVTARHKEKPKTRDRTTPRRSSRNKLRSPR